MQLREYQNRALDMLYAWFEKNATGHPVLNMPGGSGKSVVIASLAKDALQNWPDTRILMLVHSKELILQNADKLRKLWPDAPLGIYSASVGQKNLGNPITYAGIGSVAKRAKQLGHIDLCIIDEVHAVSTAESGIYRKLIADLLGINPAMRIVGLSASPYRLGQGIITEGPTAIFSEILEPVGIEELVFKQHLVPLRSKITTHRLETDGLHKRQGEYIAAEMEAKFNTANHNQSVVAEIIDKANSRAHWLIFCSGVAHSEAVAECLREAGIAAESLDATHSKTERERKLADFESGKLRALCNVGILTTGYDFPALDCISFLRSTMSPGLYLQMAVRGMRPHPGKTDCLVLDFAGVVGTHGPITNITPPTKQGDGNGEAPVKICDNCNELCPISARVCPACGHQFPEPEAKKLKLCQDDIMGLDGVEMTLTGWKWREHTSLASGKLMLAVSYYGRLSDPAVTEYFPILHVGYAGQKAMQEVIKIADKAKIVGMDVNNLRSLALQLSCGQHPRLLSYKKEGKFFRVITRDWDEDRT
ncbi:SSL2 DNA or RNA helicases of superfamily II [uncultured Caudovirales phage]|uniref:SSL2 DNA or RNA helicases of superfamily II n=1 Tax=uncultured Caudovirales phage TaxID=2100421 RepID=A0A6J5NQN6_9CAUD|nr:SSL2 DNA or RNA helicases of superfamily II [uncultured Caudovirales phage]